MDMSEEDIAEKNYRSTLPGPLGVVDTWISRVEAIILAMGVILMAINTVANVISRFAFGESLHFAEEINRILIIMITFAGIGYAARHGRHIRMSAFYDALPTGGRRTLMIFICLFTALVMFVLCYFSIGYIQTLYGRGRVLPSLSIPVWTIYLWVPIGFAITGIQYLLTAFKNLTSRDVYLSTHVVDGYKDTETEV
ncbi:MULTISPECIES: TRAP transporter small permease [Halomonadaceae]|jgi:TRAP-type C4-dicarboxylate transport system permease small subunit|uniref:TRAP transporter small permease protein n=2 Tax=Halomonadaceae TaxID=28256 RepID=A0ABS9AWC7_9GAMM|nr:TRAP transporter small permease [Halomonas aerodenitrificans]MCE8036469.1 TRAP transporter small permease [Halomonas sp. MCCC 1A11062]